MAYNYTIDASFLALKTDIPDVSLKQDKNDNNLETNSKFVVPAINEVKSSITALQNSVNQRVGYNDTSAFYFQVRNIEKEFLGLNGIRSYLQNKFKERGNFIADGGLIVYSDATTSNPYFLPFVISGSSEPIDYIIIKFAPLKAPIYINNKLKIQSLFSLKITMTDINNVDCHVTALLNTITRFTFDSELINYFFTQARVTCTSAFGTNFGKIDWSQ